MSLAATTVFEIQTGGSDTNGGGFVSDYQAQQCLVYDEKLLLRADKEV